MTLFLVFWLAVAVPATVYIHLWNRRRTTYIMLRLLLHWVILASAVTTIWAIWLIFRNTVIL